MVAGIILIVKREEIAKQKKKRLINAIIKEKTKQHKLMEKQLRELDITWNSKSIDPDTHERLDSCFRMHEGKQEKPKTYLERYRQNKKLRFL